MSSRIYFPLHRRGNHRHYSSQRFPRHCTPRHILRSSTLPLRPIHRSNFRPILSIPSLIPILHRNYLPRPMNKRTFPNNVNWSKPNFLPPTLPRPSRNTTSNSRLPRRIRILKHPVNLWSCSCIPLNNLFHFLNLRSLRKTTTPPCHKPKNSLSRMKRTIPSPYSQSPRKRKNNMT